MPEFKAGSEPYHVTLTTADGVELGLLAISDEGKPIEFEGSLTPVDATEQFRPGGIPREWSDFSAGGGYSFYDERVPNAYAWAKNVWTLVPHAAVPSGLLTEVSMPSGTHGEIRAGIEASSSTLYFSTQRYVCKVTDGTATAATVAADFAATSVTGRSGIVVTSVCLYLGTAYWGGYDTTTGTAAPLTSHVLASDAFTSGATCARWQVASFSGVDGEGNWAQWMVGTVQSGAAFKITNSASPLVDTNWTPASADGTLLGESGRQCNAIVTSRQNPYFLCWDGIRIVQRNGTYIPNITPHWNDAYWPRNGVAAALVGGVMYTAVLGGIDGVGGLDGQINDRPNFVHPGADLPNETPVAGECWAMCRDGDWLVAALYNLSRDTTYICWGKPRSSVPGQPGLTNYIWHMAPCVIEGEKVTWMRKATPPTSPGLNDPSPRLWIGTTRSSDGSTHLYWMSLPRDGNILQELAASGPWRARTDTTTLYLPSNPWYQGIHSEKALRNVATVSKNASDTSYIQPYASADEATRAELGPRVTESPYVESRIISDISGRQIAPSVDLVAGSSTGPPILRALTIWAGEGIRASTVYKGRFRFSKGMKLRTGGDDAWDDPEAVWNLLKGAQGPRPATLTDWKGKTYTIAFEQGALWKEREVRDKQHWELDATLQFTVLATDATYNDGYVYDGADADYTE